MQVIFITYGATYKLCLHFHVALFGCTDHFYSIYVFYWPYYVWLLYWQWGLFYSWLYAHEFNICLTVSQHQDYIPVDKACVSCVPMWLLFLYAGLKNGCILPWRCPSVRPSEFSGVFSTCFEISIWNLIYAFSMWHDMSSLSFITIGPIWPSLQPKVGQTNFLQSWPYKSR